MNAVATGGRSFYGARLGLLVRQTRFPRLPGDPANARSFPFAVRYAVLERADRASALEAAGRLLDEGAEGIGLAFNAGFDLADALNAPFAGALDADRSLVEAMLPPDAELGVLAFSGNEGDIFRDGLSRRGRGGRRRPAGSRTRAGQPCRGRPARCGRAPRHRGLAAV